MAPDEEKSPYRPFQTEPVEPKYAPDRGFAVTHTHLDLKIDEKARTVAGTATLTIQPYLALKRIELDAYELRVSKVSVNGKAARHENQGRTLVVHAPKSLREAKPAHVTVAYSAAPRRGMYFIHPDEAYPEKPWQVWTQGESEDNHAWFPGYDRPNNKASSEVLLTVRDPLKAVSNGHLAGSKKKAGGWTQYHWKQEMPQPNYLIAIVVGDFDEIKDHWRKVPLSYLVPRGKAAWGRETFKNTPNILEFFSTALDYPYPFPKFDQAIVADFMWGGMENTTLVTVNERFLIGPEHRADADPDGLIAHEAAHQWFGDLLTTKTWDHLWLNEGFATYFDALWHESFYGRDRLAVEMDENADAYFAEDSGRYRRAIVTRDYQEIEDLFDRHTYQKGSWVLHMLRKELGEDSWWKSIRHYVKKQQWTNVETGDLRLAIEESTGRNLEWFFDQWVRKAGHPDLEGGWTYDPHAKLVKLSLKQTQKVVGDTPLFRVKLDVRIWSGKDDFEDHVVEIRKPDAVFHLRSTTRPQAVQVDPEGWVLKKLKFEKEPAEWTFLLAHSPTAHGRMEAAHELGKKWGDPVAIPALGKALKQDKFWAVRRAAAQALGDVRTPGSRAALEPGLKDKDPLVRRAVCGALGQHRDDREAADLLLEALKSDASEYVQAASLMALARTRDDRGYKTLVDNIDRPSHNHMVASACLAGLADLRDLRALDVIKPVTARGRPQYIRSAATVALANLWDHASLSQQADLREHFAKLLRDEAHAQRRATLVALERIPDGALLGEVDTVAHNDAIGLLRNLARTTTRRMREKMGERAKLGDLKKEIEDVKTENRKLQAKMADLESRINPKKGRNGAVASKPKRKAKKAVA